MDDPPYLVVGGTSFLARAFAACAFRPACRFVGHDAVADPAVFDGVAGIVNFALDPRWRREDCPPEQCLDLRLGRIAADRGLRFVMMSSRKVYDPARQWDAHEAAPTRPVDAYGRNKLAAERGLRELLGDRLLVLRAANVFGFERQPGRRTFMAMALESLATRGEIVLDVDPGVERDFVPVDDAVALLSAALRRGIAGTYNLGSGTATPVGMIAQWVIDGFGHGVLRVTDNRAFDRFRLDSSRLRQALGAPAAVALERRCRDIGRRLAEHNPAI